MFKEIDSPRNCLKIGTHLRYVCGFVGEREREREREREYEGIGD